MARALIKHWSALPHDGGNKWTQEFEYLLSQDGYEWQGMSEVQLLQGDAGAATRDKVAAALRAVATAEFNVTIENNQVIFPDGSRA